MLMLRLRATPFSFTKEVKEVKQSERGIVLRVHPCLQGPHGRHTPRYEKWRYASETHRYITIGRPGYTEAVIRGARDWGVWDKPHFFAAWAGLVCCFSALGLVQGVRPKEAIHTFTSCPV